MQYPLTRRDALSKMGAGFGTLGLAASMHSAGLLGNSVLANEANQKKPFEVNKMGLPHFQPKAKRVIFLFMNGGPSHVDIFDYKPELKKQEGTVPKKGNRRGAGYMPSPYKFGKHGESGIEMSELVPNLSKLADDLCVIKSMHTDVPNHEPGLLLMNSGNQQPIRPSLGSWLSYGLGSENKNLPAFMVLSPGRPVVGPQLWSSSFLPGEHQGTCVNSKYLEVNKLVANIKHPHLSRLEQRKQLDLLASLNKLHSEQRQNDSELEAQVKSMEMAFNMQKEATDVFDISDEPKHVVESYGDTVFGRSCLLARRLAERDVRMTQVYYVDSGKQPWDTHSDNDKRQKTLCADSDRASAALINDLKQRGMLDDTLVIWGGEFGRTPYVQKGKGKPGRDHHHLGFSMFLAGGGVKGGLSYGNTDEFGMFAIENRVHIHDLHATILHQLGINHEKLTYRYSGRDFRLTDVHGKIVNDILV